MMAGICLIVTILWHQQVWWRYALYWVPFWSGFTSEALSTVIIDKHARTHHDLFYFNFQLPTYVCTARLQLVYRNYTLLTARVPLVDFQQGTLQQGTRACRSCVTTGHQASNISVYHFVIFHLSHLTLLVQQWLLHMCVCRYESNRLSCWQRVSADWWWGLPVDRVRRWWQHYASTLVSWPSLLTSHVQYCFVSCDVTGT